MVGKVLFYLLGLALVVTFEALAISNETVKATAMAVTVSWLPWPVVSLVMRQRKTNVIMTSYFKDVD